MSERVKIVENILSANDRLANENLRKLNEAGVFALNFMASPGAGKTSPAKRPLSDPAVGKAAERGTPMLNLVNDGRGVLAEAQDRGLIGKEVPSFDRIVGMPLGRIVLPFLSVAQRRVDPTLGGQAMSA